MKCTKCEVDKPIEEFNKCGYNESGYFTICKACKSEYYFNSKFGKKVEKKKKKSYSDYQRNYYRTHRGAKVNAKRSSTHRTPEDLSKIIPEKKFETDDQFSNYGSLVSHNNIRGNNFLIDMEKILTPIEFSYIQARSIFEVDSTKIHKYLGIRQIEARDLLEGIKVKIKQYFNKEKTA